MGTDPKSPGASEFLVPVSALRRSASLSTQGPSAFVKPSQQQAPRSATPFTFGKQVAQKVPEAGGCWLSFFFDGTGNNLDADCPEGSKLADREHSNVARLYRAHPDEKTPGFYRRFYIPGIATYFRDVGDKGGTTKGNAFGGGGEERLDWAMDKLHKAIAESKDSEDPINVALFGFSRGAALARAFARRIARQCNSNNGQWFLYYQRARPINLYFMGLFDTVASVGTAAKNNRTVRAAIKSAVLNVSIQRTLRKRSSKGKASLYSLAPGLLPGADPTPSRANGHDDWGSDLRIPAMVKRCVHMVAAHELRNSFPLDSLLDVNGYPSNCEEIVYPGVHSDVGGGYREAEGARGLQPGGQLSLIPLRDMYDKALQYGVPLSKDFKSATLKEDFAYDTDSSSAYQKMKDRFGTYTKSVGNGDMSLGMAFLAHMKRYYQWRFHRIALNEQAWKEGKKTEDESRIQGRQETWSKQKRAEKNDMKLQRKKYNQLSWEAEPRSDEEGFSIPRTAQQEQYFQQSILQKDVYLKARARYGTGPWSFEALIKNLKMYDHQLLADAKILQAISNNGKTPLRPHYQAILDAYVAEFEQGCGLENPEIISFFDDYVHDSLAGFATDATLPSDPRCIYMGGDDELKYAVNGVGAFLISDTA